MQHCGRDTVIARHRPAAADAQLPFDVDDAKLAAPPVRHASVRKSHTIAALCGSTNPVASVIAPAGYGKTTLLGQWATDDIRSFAWISIDQGDDDGLTLLRHIATAIHRVEPIASSVFDALSGPVDNIWTRLPRVGNALAALREPIVVVLDDVHAISNATSLNVIAALVDYVPPGSQLVLATRDQAALPLARWRARGMLTEIGRVDLRLDDAEADLLLKGAGVVLGPSEVAELTDETEGWPAGLYLAALSIRSGAPGISHNRGFSGDDRYVSDYFRLEVLSRLPSDEARFAMYTSVLDTMSGPMCDVILQTGGSAHILEAMASSNLFVVPLDHRGDRYRYHHLFRQLLQIELERTELGMVAELNRRAMKWCLADGQHEAAIRFGQAAGAREDVAALVDYVALPLYRDGRMDSLSDLLGWFDDADLARFPAIAVYGGWVRALTGHAAQAARYLSIADSATSTIPLSDGSATIDPWVATLRSSMMPDGAERALADAANALTGLAPASPWRSAATVMSGIANSLLGQTGAARADLTAAIDLARPNNARDVEFTAQAELALLAVRQGAWLDATHHVEAGRRIVEEGRLEHYALAAIVHVAVARLALFHHRPLEARSAMKQVHRLRPLLDHSIPWLTVQVGIELTRAHLSLGEVDAARTTLADTLAVLKRRPALGLLVGEVDEMRRRVAAVAGPGAWAVNLTAAELRLLPYLATYLTYPEIASRLFITSHTVRSEAKAIYRKLDASSRAEAIEQAIEVGLLEPMFPHRASVAV
jgi:LuxR family maltose regulon positive regulatory protein